MPKELICPERGRIEWREYEEPALAPDQVRVRCEHAAEKTGTATAFTHGHGALRGSWNAELALFDADRPLTCWPLPLGNMAVGQVIEAGGEVQDLRVGDRVYFHSSLRPTAVAAETQCRKLPDGVAWQSAVCLDPAACALGAVRDGNVRVGDAVAVFGCGAIGLMTVRLSVLAGARTVLAVEPLANRRAVAESLGAGVALDPADEDVGLALKHATGTRGVDVAIDFSGAMGALQAALRGVAFGGTVVLGGFPSPHPAGLDLGAEAHINRPNVIFSRGYSDPGRDHPRWDWDRILDTCGHLIDGGQLDGRKVVTPVVAFDDLLEEYPRIASEPQTVIKLGVRFG